jgi:hypothetical protein
MILPPRMAAMWRFVEVSSNDNFLVSIVLERVRPREVSHPNHYSNDDDDDDDDDDDPCHENENDEDDEVSTAMLLEWLQLLEDYYHFPRTWWW